MEAEADAEGSLMMKEGGGRAPLSLSYLAKCEPGMLKVCQRLAMPMRRAEKKKWLPLELAPMNRRFVSDGKEDHEKGSVGRSWVQSGQVKSMSMAMKNLLGVSV